MGQIACTICGAFVFWAGAVAIAVGVFGRRAAPEYDPVREACLRIELLRFVAYYLWPMALVGALDGLHVHGFVRGDSRKGLLLFITRVRLLVYVPFLTLLETIRNLLRLEPTWYAYCPPESWLPGPPVFLGSVDEPQYRITVQRAAVLLRCWLPIGFAILIAMAWPWHWPGTDCGTLFCIWVPLADSLLLGGLVWIHVYFPLSPAQVKWAGFLIFLAIAVVCGALAGGTYAWAG